MRTSKEQAALIHEKVSQHNSTKKKRMKYIYSLSTLAACLGIVFVVVFTTTDLFNSPEPPYGQNRNEQQHMAYVYDYLNIFFITEQGSISYESVMMRFLPHDIFAKWVELNNVNDVSFVNSLLDRDIEVIYHGDPAAPETAVSVQLGDYAVFRLTLSHEFTAYMDGERGRRLIESLEKTFYYYLGFDEFDLIIE
ncbi:MAG: hypothetical protein FWB91_05290 [Defluviitaleaceae bacterium]|nr:hypothetical protein [Defluviitaleaceae bacterium]